jgi:endo-1,4-beta-xylanase
MKTVTLLCLVAAWLPAADEPKAVLLWPNGAPGSEGRTAAETVRVTDGGERVVASVHAPSITPYLPARESATGAAVVIAPGGGHRELWTDHEGHNVAKWLSARGVAGFVLKYRLAREAASLADIQRAIRVVRKNAFEWGVNPDRVGVMGFSAGGELAALAASRYRAPDDGAPDTVDRHSEKSFQALIYPAIPGDMKLSKETPPAFLVCGENDRENISQGLPQLYLSMRRAGVTAELHVYAGVGHGFGVRERNRGPVAGWPGRFYEWLEGRGFVKR